jgi:hypothetical protein
MASQQSVSAWFMHCDCNCFFVIVSLINLDSWFYTRRITKRQKNREQSIYRSLNSEELLYLFQFIRYRSTLVEFNSREPVVRLLSHKGLIHQSLTDIFPNSSTPKFRWDYDYSKIYEISPETYEYLSKNKDLFFKELNRGNSHSDSA